MTESEIQQSRAPDSALKRLDIFVGRWITEGHTWATSSSPALRITGTDTYEWLPGRFFLLHRADVQIGDEEIKTIEIIGYDALSQTYPMHYFDNQGNSGTYQASVRDGIWTFLGGSERSKVTFSDDGNTITASWEHSDNGLNWLPLMEVKLTKVEDFTAHPGYTAPANQDREIVHTHSGKSAKSSAAPLNGLNMYYEIHGTGRPLILLHGGVGASEMFGPILPKLAENTRVVTVHLQAHGRTEDIDRPLSFELMADDIAALIKFLGIGKADLLGYSLGAGVALQTAIRHPETIRKLVVISAPFSRDGWYPEVLEGMAHMGPEAAQSMKQTPLYQLYPDIEWEVLFTKLKDLLRQDYNWSRDVATIRAPIMLAFADADAVRTTHMAEFFALLGGGKQDAGLDDSLRPTAWLTILPGTTHYNLLSSPELASLVTRFLDAPMPDA
ncbi:alpha/beta fold hydrolase [Methanosarcina sp. MSH10X1]|uniref:alpha/beta fold hydrolase n=1 Tax=Methanosarcina sp. MSH10X1 TaxID=2507075 RepID=UPI000FFC692E|nr:alpha/beta fold hydrolase [Methanosarcina sp. MSH10X1]RXA20856.1 alpha/beta fold hydrolase [Methanosarcina sp. MSH10X1]